MAITLRRQPQPLQTLLNLSSVNGQLLNSTSRVRFTLSSQIDIPTHADTQLGVTSISIARSWWTTTAANNTIHINGFDYSVAPGSYGASTLATALTAAMAAIPATCTYNSTRLTFVITSAVVLNYSAANSSIARTIGFTVDKTGVSLESDSAIDLAGTRAVHLAAYGLPTTTRESFLGGSISPVLDTFPVTVASGFVMTIINPSPRTIEVPAGGILSELTLALLDDEGEEIDLRGSHWTVSLLVRSVYFDSDTSVGMEAMPQAHIAEIAEQSNVQL